MGVGSWACLCKVEWGGLPSIRGTGHRRLTLCRRASTGPETPQPCHAMVSGECHVAAVTKAIRETRLPPLQSLPWRPWP